MPTLRANKPDTTLAIGARHEQQALEYLKNSGLTLIEKNFRTRLGELDLIMRDGKTLVFIEVRYRKNTQFGGPIESVSYQKQQRLLRAAHIYLSQRQQFQNLAYRFDIVGITGTGTDQRIEWIQNAFEDSF